MNLKELKRAGGRHFTPTAQVLHEHPLTGLTVIGSVNSEINVGALLNRAAKEPPQTAP
jgi:hypothetical protein